MSPDETSEQAGAGSGTSPEHDYESAAARLDEIIARLDSGQAQLRETLDLCAEAKDLIEFCAAELSAVDQGLKELRLEDLAESLRPAAAAGSPSGSSVASSGSSTAEEFAQDHARADPGPQEPDVPDRGDPGPDEPPF